MFYTFLYLKAVFQSFLHLLEVSFIFECVFRSCTHVLCVRASWPTHWGSCDSEAAELSFCIQSTLLRWSEPNQPLSSTLTLTHRLQVLTLVDPSKHWSSSVETWNSWVQYRFSKTLEHGWVYLLGPQLTQDLYYENHGSGVIWLPMSSIYMWFYSNQVRTSLLLMLIFGTVKSALVCGRTKREQKQVQKLRLHHYVRVHGWCTRFSNNLCASRQTLFAPVFIKFYFQPSFFLPFCSILHLLLLHMLSESETNSCGSLGFHGQKSSPTTVGHQPVQPHIKPVSVFRPMYRNTWNQELSSDKRKWPKCLWYSCCSCLAFKNTI